MGKSRIRNRPARDRSVALARPRRAACDRAYLEMVEATLTEWASAEDAKTYDRI
jgi:hypothetical protein